MAKEQPLTVEEKRIFKSYFAKNVIEQARIIDGNMPFWLRKGMKALVLKHHIYLRCGIYLSKQKM
jgi:hypothetical protein